MGRGGGEGMCGVCRIIFLVFSNFHIKKDVRGIKGLKLMIRIMSSVTMLKHDIIYKRCYVKYNKSCLKGLKLSTLVLKENYFLKISKYATLNFLPMYR